MRSIAVVLFLAGCPRSGSTPPPSDPEPAIVTGSPVEEPPVAGSSMAAERCQLLSEVIWTDNWETIPPGFPGADTAGVSKGELGTSWSAMFSPRAGLFAELLADLQACEVLADFEVVEQPTMTTWRSGDTTVILLGSDTNGAELSVQ